MATLKILRYVYIGVGVERTHGNFLRECESWSKWGPIFRKAGRDGDGGDAGNGGGDGGNADGGDGDGYVLEEWREGET